MKLNSVVFKIGTTILFLQLIILIPLGFIILQLILNYSINETERQLVQLSEKYASQVTELEDPESLKLLEHLTEMTDTSAIIIDDDREIIIQTNLEEGFSAPYLTEELYQQLQSENTVVQEYNDGGSTYLKVAQRLTLSNGEQANLIVYSSFGLIGQSFHNIVVLVMLASLGAVVLATGFTFFISKKLGSPLVEMEKVAKQIAEKKNFSLRVNYEANDEIGSLANAINHLSETLERYQTNRNELKTKITNELKTTLTKVKKYADAVN